MIATAEPATLPALLAQRARTHRDAVALRVKRRGIYQDVSWGAYCAHVRNLALGFRSLGLKRGDRVAIMGDPCPEWVYAELAALSAGAISFGIYPTSSLQETAYLLRHSGATLAVAENQEYVDKLLPALEGSGEVRNIVVVDTSAMFAYRDPRIVDFADLARRGADLAAGDAGLFANLASAVAPDDVAIIVYTSGTTGEPQGAMYTHRALLQQARQYSACVLPGGGWDAHTIAHLPLNHIFEQLNTVLLPLVAGTIPHFGESIDALAETLLEVSPDLYASVPRYWQKFASRIVTSMETSSPLKRLAYRFAMRIGRATLAARRARRPLAARALYEAARWLVFRRILAQLGLHHVGLALTAGAPMPSGLQTLWQIWGVDLRNLYGQTEAGFVAVQRRPFPAPGDVGPPPPGCEVRLEADGEILVRSPGSFCGYLGNDAATRATCEDGWVRTGDVGQLDGSVLLLVDRKKDILITAGGKNISPIHIESMLKESPYIVEAVVIADGRKYVTALIEIDYDNVAEWARARSIPYSGHTGLATCEPVRELIAGEVAKANVSLGRVESVKKFRVIPRELDSEIEGEPVTPTRKVKRRLMRACFADLIEQMYAEVGADAIDGGIITNRVNEKGDAAFRSDV